MTRALPGDDGYCPECEHRLMVEVEEDDETGDKRSRFWCENCGWDPALAAEVLDLVKMNRKQEGCEA